jgi:aubergine
MNSQHSILSNLYQLNATFIKNDGILTYEYGLSTLPNQESQNKFFLFARKALGICVWNSSSRVVVCFVSTSAFSFEISGETFVLSPIGSRFYPSKSTECLRLVRLICDSFLSMPSYQRLKQLFIAKRHCGNENLQVLSGFTARPCFIEGGFFIRIDTVFRAIHRKNLLDTVESSLDNEENGAQEWSRRCLNSIVVTLYNNRVYRVKAVRFDMSPSSAFLFKTKCKASVYMNFSQFVGKYYQRTIHRADQPLLEAYAEKTSEQVILIPELCALTGLNEEMRKDRILMQEVLQQSMISPAARLESSISIIKNLSVSNSLSRIGISLSLIPRQLSCIKLDSVEISFGTKSYLIEDGNFQRIIRNCSHCPLKLSHWIVIYTESDRALAIQWIRSFRELGSTGFGVMFEEPLHAICSNQIDELEGLLLNIINPNTQLVMLFTPPKDFRKVYQNFKLLTSTVRPCVTQVIKSETLRKRQSIVAIVSRIVLQISAKLLSPLWTAPYLPRAFESPYLFIGIDLCQRKETKKNVVSVVSSLDSLCTQFFSQADIFNDEDFDHKMVCFIYESIVAFSDFNKNILPSALICFRGSVQRALLEETGQAELKLVKEAIFRVNSAISREKAYEPKISYIVSLGTVGERFFESDEIGGTRSPRPGTVVSNDTNEMYLSFFMINQFVSRGTAVPSLLYVILDEVFADVKEIQNVSYILSHLYFNFPGSTRLPAPLQYAKKLACFMGSILLKNFHPRLSRSLFYL